tara:strand:+ start:352 stop:1845 length:1494 start_codon:yes stop_codon:yes gene_type:complete
MKPLFLIGALSAAYLLTSKSNDSTEESFDSTSIENTAFPTYLEKSVQDEQFFIENPTSSFLTIDSKTLAIQGKILEKFPFPEQALKNRYSITFKEFERIKKNRLRNPKTANQIFKMPVPLSQVDKVPSSVSGSVSIVLEDLDDFHGMSDLLVSMCLGFTFLKPSIFSLNQGWDWVSFFAYHRIVCSQKLTSTLVQLSDQAYSGVMFPKEVNLQKPSVMADLSTDDYWKYQLGAGHSLPSLDAIIAFLPNFPGKTLPSDRTGFYQSVSERAVWDNVASKFYSTCFATFTVEIMEKGSQIPKLVEFLGNLIGAAIGIFQATIPGQAFKGISQVLSSVGRGVSNIFEASLAPAQKFTMLNNINSNIEKLWNSAQSSLFGFSRLGPYFTTDFMGYKYKLIKSPSQTVNFHNQDGYLKGVFPNYFALSSSEKANSYTGVDGVVGQLSLVWGQVDSPIPIYYNSFDNELQVTIPVFTRSRGYVKNTTTDQVSQFDLLKLKEKY